MGYCGYRRTHRGSSATARTSSGLGRPTARCGGTRVGRLLGQRQRKDGLRRRSRLLTDAIQRCVRDERWVAELGGLRIVKSARSDPLTGRRFVLPSGLEVEVGIAPTAMGCD